MKGNLLTGVAVLGISTASLLPRAAKADIATIHKMSSTSNPLRASCERCRAQKIRCVPSSQSTTGAPCQRCTKANVPELCLFESRFKTGRTRRNRILPGTGGSSPPIMSGKEKDTTSLPGMSTFTLSRSTTRSPDPDASAMPPVNQREAQFLGIDDSLATLDFSDPWQNDPVLLNTFGFDDFHLLDDISYTKQAGFADSSMARFSFDSPTDTKLQNRQASCTGPITEFDMDMDMDVLYKERPSPAIDLTTILAEMCAYETRISKLADCPLHDYPVGDALFLSHRFHATLLRTNNNASGNSSGYYANTPTMLLAFSCFMTLTRTYSVIFDFLLEQLSQMLCGQYTNQCADLPYGSDIHLYRGLRLSQLQSLCLCSNWNPARKAVTMLLKSLRDTEGFLALPPNLRAVASDNVDKHEQSIPSTAENVSLFGESSMAMPTNDYLYRTMESQATRLKDQIERAESLLRAWRAPCSHTPPSSPRDG